MHDADSRIRALILAYEDLDAEDRRKADEFLARNPGVRRKLARLQELEEWARDPVPIEEGVVSSEHGLSADDEMQLASSLEALRKRLDLPADSTADPSPSPTVPPRASTRTPRRGLPRTWIPLAAAAVLTLLVWSPWSGRDPALFGHVSIVAVDTVTGTSRGAEDSRAWHSGEVFALSFQLEADASVIVYHVDPSGRVSLVVPGSPSEAIPSYEAGLTHRIPSATSEEQWVLGEETGRESFLLAASEDPELNLSELDREVHARLADMTDRELILESLRALLAKTLDTVQLIEFDHLP